jgi:hypothetical protein
MGRGYPNSKCLTTLFVSLQTTIKNYRIYPAIHLFNIRNLFLFKVPYFGLATALSGLAVGMLYFYASFWLFAQTGTPLAIRIIAGVVFSVTIIAGVF